MRIFNDIKQLLYGTKEKYYLKDVNGDPIIDFKGNYLDVDKKLFDKYVSLVENYCLRIESLSGSLTLKESFMLLEEAHNLADMWINLFASHCPCHPGCSACCDELFPVYSIEADYILHYILNNIDKTVPKSLVNTIKAHQTNHCPFLSTEGLCIVYKARPLVCRTHIVVSTPAEDCLKLQGRPLEGGIPNLLMNSVYNLASAYSLGMNLPLAMTFSGWFRHGIE